MKKADSFQSSPSSFCWCCVRTHAIFLFIAVTLGFILRLYKINNPVADWHSWRQADTASVTREFVKHRYPITLPHYHDLSNIASGQDNLQGYRMVEFPIENYVIAQVLIAFPQLDLVMTSRMFTIVLSLISIVAIYSIVFQLSNKKALAFCSALVFAVLPYSVYYSRVILPDPAMVACELVAFAAFIHWIWLIKNERTMVSRIGWGVFSIVMFMLALLLKPMAAFMLPVFPVLALYEFEWSAFKKWELYFFPALIFLPLVWWRMWILQFPSGIPVSSWLLNGNGIRLHPAWWHWIFADRIGRLILGYWGLIFLFLGFIHQEGRKRLSSLDWVVIAWSLSMFAYLAVFATGNVQHDYYQIPIIPIIAIVVGRGLWSIKYLAQNVGHPMMVFSMTAFALALTVFISWYEVHGYYSVNNWDIMDAGKAVDRLTPPDAKVIAQYGGDTAFLFQTNRTGWPIGTLIEEKIKLGAQYYVTTSYDDEAHYLEKNYQVVEKTPKYILIKLTK